MEYSGLSNLESLIEDVVKLVSLPDVYYRLEALIERPDSTLDDFARVLETDPEICARLLSLANSAFYGFPASIETVDKAVQIIGVRQIRELVLATTILRTFDNIPLGMVDMRMFWEHSVAVGVLAKSISQYCHLSQPERYYVAGLLHDLGRLLFYLKMPGLMHDLLLEREAQEENLYLLEERHLGYSHSEAGGALLKKWRVPESIYAPVACHHHVSKCSDYSPVAAAVHVADAWINKYQVGSSGERFPVLIQAEALEILKLQTYELDEIWVLAEEEIKDVFNQFLQQ
jgi:HD-like signal output (HDOD) protein